MTLKAKWEAASAAQRAAARAYWVAEGQRASDAELDALQKAWDKARTERREAFQAYMDSDES